MDQNYSAFTIQRNNLLDKAAISKKIREQCEKKGISKDYLASALNLNSIETIDRYFSGEDLPTTEHLIKICEILDISSDEVSIYKPNSDEVITNHMEKIIGKEYLSELTKFVK